MSNNLHIIKKCILDININQKKKAIDIQNIINDVVKKQFPDIINKIIKKYNSDETIIIDRIELNLGKFTHQNLEKQIVSQFEKKLTESIKVNYKEFSKKQSSEKNIYNQSISIAVNHYLLTGQFIWWLDVNKYKTFFDLIKEALTTDYDAVKSIILDIFKLRKTNQILRIINQIENKDFGYLLIALISKYEAENKINTQFENFVNYYLNKYFNKTQKTKFELLKLVNKAMLNNLRTDAFINNALLLCQKKSNLDLRTLQSFGFHNIVPTNKIPETKEEITQSTINQSFTQLNEIQRNNEFENWIQIIKNEILYLLKHSIRNNWKTNKYEYKLQQLTEKLKSVEINTQDDFIQLLDSEIANEFKIKFVSPVDIQSIRNFIRKHLLKNQKIHPAAFRKMSNDIFQLFYNYIFSNTNINTYFVKINALFLIEKLNQSEIFQDNDYNQIKKQLHDHINKLSKQITEYCQISQAKFLIDNIIQSTKNNIRITESDIANENTEKTGIEIMQKLDNESINESIDYRSLIYKKLLKSESHLQQKIQLKSNAINISQILKQFPNDLLSMICSFYIVHGFFPDWSEQLIEKLEKFTDLSSEKQKNEWILSSIIKTLRFGKEVNMTVLTSQLFSNEVFNQDNIKQLPSIVKNILFEPIEIKNLIAKIIIENINQKQSFAQIINLKSGEILIEYLITILNTKHLHELVKSNNPNYELKIKQLIRQIKNLLGNSHLNFINWEELERLIYKYLLDYLFQNNTFFDFKKFAKLLLEKISIYLKFNSYQDFINFITFHISQAIKNNKISYINLLFEILKIEISSELEKNEFTEKWQNIQIEYDQKYAINLHITKTLNKDSCLNNLSVLNDSIFDIYSISIEKLIKYQEDLTKIIQQITNDIQQINHPLLQNFYNPIIIKLELEIRKLYENYKYENLDTLERKQQTMYERLLEKFPNTKPEQLLQKLINEKLDWTESEEIEDKIYIRNSGLVLLWVFLPHLFKRLELIEIKKGKNQFVSNQAKEKAVLLTYFLITGKTTPEEYELALNKIICGIPIDKSIRKNTQLTETEINECNNLLKSAIKHWNTLGNIGIDSFRRTFLERNGILVNNLRSWNLNVENMAIDVLITKIPWTFKTVKFSWTDYIIFVEWNF